MSLEDLADVRAEKALLCCALKGGPDLVAEIIAGGDVEMFSEIGLQAIWEVLTDLVSDDTAIDLILVERALLDRDRLDDAGGRPALEEIANFTHSHGSWEQYLEVCNDFATRRRIRKAGVQLQSEAYDREKEPDAIVEGAEGVMTALHEAQDSEVLDGRELMRRVTDRIELCYANRGQLIGIPLGFPDIDRVILGMEPSEIMFIGGRPSMGKTGFLQSTCEKISVRPHDAPGYPEEPFPGLFFSLEMPDIQVGTRAVVSLAGAMQRKDGQMGLDLRKVRSGMLAQRDFPKLIEASAVYADAPLWWDESSDMTIAEMKAKIRLMVRKHGVRVVYIDYVQLIKPVTKAGQREERIGIAEVCAGLKAVAKQLGINIIALAQTNRGSEENRGRKPRLKDFDGSSAIEKFGDYCAFIHRESKVKNFGDHYEEWQGAQLNEARASMGDEWNWKEIYPRLYGGAMPAQFDNLTHDKQDAIYRQRAIDVYESKAEFLLCKNRHGPEPELPLRFIGPLARFETCTHLLYSNNETQRQPTN